MAKLIPILFLIIGAAIGGGAGMFLKPPPAEECVEEPCPEADANAQADEEETTSEPHYVAMKNQFVVPVIRGEKVQSLVVLSLSLEAPAESAEIVFSREPKLRDVFLRVLFDHAHTGGFDGAFTETGRMEVLRSALLEAGRAVMGDILSDILITEIVRQET